jgi:hypothetical protein
MAIGVAKSVSFEKKQTVSDLEIVLKNIKNKKIRRCGQATGQAEQQDE